MSGPNSSDGILANVSLTGGVEYEVILGQFTGNADVTDAKVFAVEVGSVHLDVDISDSLAAITAATSNGQLSAVLDAASSVTASNTVLPMLLP